MQIKNINSFKEFFSLPVQSQEAKFLFGSFFKGSVHFVLIGLAAALLSWFNLSYVTGGNFSQIIGWQAFFGIAGLFVIMFMRYYWTSRVASVSRNFVVALFLINFLANTAIFSMFLTGLTALELSWFTNGSQVSYRAATALPLLFKFVLIIFGTSFIVYAIPATIAFMIRSRKVMASIFKVYSVATLIAIGLLAIVTIGYIFGFGSKAFGTINVGLNFLMVLVVLMSPMITIFRLRSLLAVLNFNDADLVKNWESFFAFQIMSDLLSIAYYLARFLFYIYSRSR